MSALTINSIRILSVLNFDFNALFFILLQAEAAESLDLQGLDYSFRCSLLRSSATASCSVLISQ